MEKRGRGSNIICSITLRLLGKISSAEDGKGTEILGKKIKFKKDEGGEEYQTITTFIHPCDITRKIFRSGCIILF